MIVLKCIHNNDSSKNFCFISYRLQFSSGCHIGFLFSKACRYIYNSNNFITEYTFIFHQNIEKEEFNLLHGIKL